jgi:glycosyltransferase involved in cell wall biosynthesis
LKILFDYQVFCIYEHGGIARYYNEIVSHINQIDGIDVSVFCPFFSGAGASLPADVKKLLICRRPKIRYTQGLSKRVNDLLVGAGLLEAWGRRQGVDVVHQTFNINRHRKPNFPVVHTVHDLIPEKLWGRKEDKQKLVKEADHVICVSNATRDDFLEHYDYDASKVSVIHHGLTDFSQMALRTSEPHQRPYIMYVGGRSGYKNFDRLFKAYALSESVWKEFDLVCFGGDPLCGHESELLSRFPKCSERVHFISGSDQKLANYYSKAVAFIYPSIYEGFGLPLIEAMNLGCPVICSDIKCFREVAGTAAGYFDPVNIESIQSALIQYLFSPSWLRDHSRLGMNSSRQYSWSKCASETVEVYKKCL